MLQQLTAALVILLTTYVFTLMTGYALNAKNKLLQTYKISTDPYIYIFGILSLTLIGVFIFTPAFNDSIVPVRASFLITNLIFAALIYVVFITDIKKLLLPTIFASSVISAFLFINPDSLPEIVYIPKPLQILCIGLFMGLVTFSAKLMAGITGVFSLCFSMASLGLILISYAGGLPVISGLMATALFGIFVSVFLFNRYETNLIINEGAMMSLAFVFCTLICQGINELAAPSIFILVVYFLVELTWSVSRQYLLHKREPELFFNTFYFSCAQKGLALISIHTMLFKLCIVNIILALFELHMPNAFTLPIFAVVINCWLLSKMYNIEPQPVENLEQKTKSNSGRKKHSKKA